MQVMAGVRLLVQCVGKSEGQGTVPNLATRVVAPRRGRRRTGGHPMVAEVVRSAGHVTHPAEGETGEGERPTPASPAWSRPQSLSRLGGLTKVVAEGPRPWIWITVSPSPVAW